MSEIILIRGIPGSGKSTLAKKLEDYIHIEADMFFEKDGEYIYEASKIKDAHEWCKRKTLGILKEGNNVVISNTFTCIWEMKPYLNMGVPISIIEAKGNWQNIHYIPDMVISRMRQKWQELPIEMEYLLKGAET